MPEYSTSPKIVQAIQDKLLQLQSEGKHTPILTFAGSQWTSDNNNVQYILDGSGKILDEYYKYCNFRDPKKDYEEALNNPGKRCVFFYVEGVGLIFPSICRDVIDPNYTRYLAGLFYPLLVINSAWSKSVDHICEPFHSIAYEYLSSSVFANSCSALMEKFEAREEEKAPIGHCHITSKEKTIPEPISKEYIREKNCNDCSLGCLFISEFFFGQYKETIDNDKS